ADEDLVEGLRVPLEDVRVSLVLGERLDQGVERGPFEDGQGIRELEVVEIAEHDDVCETVDCEDLPREMADDGGLLRALQLGGAHGWLEPAHERLIPALRVEVVRYE